MRVYSPRIGHFRKVAGPPRHIPRTMTVDEFKATPQGKALWHAIERNMAYDGSVDHLVGDVFNAIAPLFITQMEEFDQVVAESEESDNGRILAEAELAANGSSVSRRAELVQLVGHLVSGRADEFNMSNETVDEIIDDAKSLQLGIDRNMKGASHD